MSVQFVVAKILSSSMEAQFAKGALEASGIPAEVRGAKEYSAHYTGIDHGRYEILVPEDDLVEAKKLLTERLPEDSYDGIQKYSKDRSGLLVLNEEFIRGGSIRKATFLWLISIILIPVVGNLLSIYQSWQLLRDKRIAHGRDLFILAMIIAVNVIYLIGVSVFILHRW